MSPDKKTSPIPDSPRTVLIVENEHLAAMHLVRCIEKIDIQIVGPASNAEKALQLAESDKPDLAVVDIRMPGIDGLQVAKDLFDQHHIPVIILSAFSDPQYIKQASATGVFGYLLKPAMLDDLRVNLAIAWSCYRSYATLKAENEDLKRQLGLDS